MCEDDRTVPILKMSNSGTSECKQEHFQNYEPEEPQFLVLLHRNRVRPISVKRCHLHLASTVSLCENGRSNSPRQVYNGPIYVNADTCMQMHNEGHGTVIIGEEEREFSGLKVEAPFHTQVLLGGSKEVSLTLDLLSTKMGCVPMTGKLWKGYGYNGPSHRLSPFAEPWFSTGNLVISLDEEQGFVDYEGKFISIPRVGKRLPFKEKNQNGKIPTIEHQSV